MALQMRVYKEIASVEAKVMWGLSWRQLAAATCMLVLGGGQVFVFCVLLKQTDIGSCLLFVVCLPFALWGWWRPKGLKPERYLGFMVRQLVGVRVYTLEPLESQRFPHKPSLKERDRKIVVTRKEKHDGTQRHTQAGK